MPPIAAHTEDAFVRAKGRPARDDRTRRERTEFPWLRLCLGSGAVTAALIVLARPPEPALIDAPEWAVADPAPVIAPPPLWDLIERPAAIFAMEAPSLRELPFAYAARRARDGAREDTLTFGTAEGDRPYLRVAAHQSPQPEPHGASFVGASFFVDLARRAADAGLAVGRSAPASGLQTKFGAAEVADVVLSGSAERACLAFRLERPEAALRVGGWLCSAGGEPPSQRQLGCLIDGLSLRSAEDAQLSDLFAGAERQRDPSCAPPRRVAETPAPPSRNARRR